MSKNRPKTPIAAPLPTENTRLDLLIPCLTAVVTFMVFLPALNNGFVNWDDMSNIAENQNYRGLGWQQLKWMFTTFHLGPYQPLSWVSYGIDYLLWGMKPFGYHLTNIILHSVNAAIFCLLNLKLLALSTIASARERRADLYLSAAFAALFFSIHPLRVESVAWVTERRDVLSGLFYLLTLLWYVKSNSKEATQSPSWKRHVLPLIFCLFALLSKGMAISLPVVLLIIDFYPLKRLDLNSGSWFAGGNRAVWLEKLPYFLMAAAFGVVGVLGQAQAGALKSYENTGFSVRAAQVPFAVGFYIWKTVMPLKLSPLYKFIGGLTDPTVLLCSAVMLAFTAAAISVRRRWPVFPAVWFYYLVVLTPVSGIVKFGFQAKADRYTYLPCLGFAVLAGAGFITTRQIKSR